MKRAAIATLLSTVCLSFASLSSAWAAPTPRLKPTPPPQSEYINATDAQLLRRAISAANRDDWSAIRALTASVADPVTRDVMRWLVATGDPHATLGELTYAARSFKDWPRHVTIMAKAEDILFESPLPPNDVLSFFNGSEPVSGEGRVALARAYYSLRDDASGDLWLRSAWRDSRLTRDRQKEVFGQYKGRLNREDHAARADHLIWLGRRHFTKANALLPHMAKSDAALMTARMKLARNASGMNRAIDAIPDSELGDAGFLFERARWRRRKKSKDYALPVYLQIETAPTHEDGRERLWRENKLMAFWLISEDRPTDAYRLTRNHGFSRGSDFAEAEFLAGWLAMRHLNKPSDALEHFKSLETGVSTPISLARAKYWQGRALEAMGDQTASAVYAQAAQYPNTFYGQLAAVRRGDGAAQISLPPEIVTPTAQANFEANPLIKALRILGEAGEETLFSTFAYHLDDTLPDLEQLSLLSQLSADYGMMRPSLRAAKQAGRFQTMLTDSGYPLVAPIEGLGDEFDIPFVYAIARQESEFAANAVSSANAYGMMQMIEPTARATARKHRIAFDRHRLIADRDYSARLGALHLHDLLERFDGSYILAAVGYNAGPHRAKTWIETYGDPRTGEIDPIDWIESIPFSETRNYVMRVLENMQVYRARRSNDSAPVTIDQDLRFGSSHPAIR